MNQASGGNVIYKFIGDDKKLQSTVKGVKGTLSGLGSVMSAVGASVLGVTTVIGGALIGITKQSVEAYGELEQLAGGAQKIFDEMDYDKIAEDARKAYQTMNLSASQYLALINDVGATFASTMGDERGYETAKQGLQAISDYATGTGKNVDLLGQKFTMITRATSSYQSIADQFSGVLPATSQSFLEQAQAVGLLSSEYTKLTDVPIDEYQQAVAGMLEQGVAKLGLANNTLTESTQTLTGSIASARSAIQNFLSGAGGFEEVVDTVVIAGKQIGQAVIKMLPQIVKGIVGIIKGLIPQIPGLIKTLLPSLFTGVVDLIRGLADMAPELVTILAEMLPEIITGLVNMFVDVANALAKEMPKIVPLIVKALVDSLTVLFENIDVIIGACLALIIGISDGLIQSLPYLIEKIPDIVDAILNALIDSAPILIEAGIKLVGCLLDGIIRSLPKIIDAIFELNFVRIPQIVRDAVPRLIDAGRNMIIGIWNGIKSYDIVGKIKDLAKSMLNGMKKVLGIHSPSTEFAWLGEMSMRGYTDQLENMKGMLDDVIDSTFSLSPQLTSGDLHYSPNVVVNNNITSNTDSLGQTVTSIKTFANGAKNDYNYGMGV